MLDEKSEIIKKNAMHSNRRNARRPAEMTIPATAFMRNRSQLAYVWSRDGKGVSLWCCRIQAGRT